MRSLALAILAVLLVTAPVGARAEDAAAFTDVPDRFTIEIGGFNVATDTKLRLSSERLAGGTVDFEKDLQLPDTSQRGFVDAYWRVGRKHLLNLSFNRLHRESPGRTTSREVSWGGNVYPIGLKLVGRLNSDAISGAYRFAAYRNPRFEIGPALGFGYIWLTAGVRAETAGGLSVDRSATTGSVTGDLGGYFQWWATKRLDARGDLRYILIKPEKSEAAVTEGRIGLVYHVWPKVGFGAQYTYSKFRYDRDILATKLSGTYRYGGAQLLASFAFR